MIRVPGTRVALRPPEGFRAASQFQGFEAPELEASIGITELPTPVEELRRGLVGAEVVVDGRRGLLVESEQELFGETIHRSMVVLGDPQRSVILVATAPSGGALGDRLREALLSASWAPDQPPADDDLGFRFTESPPLRIATRMGRVALLTEQGGIGLDPLATMMTIGAVPAEPSRPLGEIALDHLSSLPGLEGVAAVSAEDLSLGEDLPAAELLGEGLTSGDGRPIRIYQLVVRLGDEEIVAIGRTAADRFDGMLGAFRAVARSLR